MKGGGGAGGLVIVGALALGWMMDSLARRRKEQEKRRKEQESSREETSDEETEQSEQESSHEETSNEETERSSEQESSCEETSDEETEQSEQERLRRAWQRYLREGCRNHRLARQLLTRVHRPLRPLPAGSMASPRERIRHAAEVKFFESHSRGARRLMARVVEQLFRTPSSLPADPIDLRGQSARVVIAASRLLQETLIVLSGSFNPSVQEGGPLAPTYRGIPVGRTNGYCHYGPPETYVVGDATLGTAVTCEHRTEPLSDDGGQRSVALGHNLERLGDTFVRNIGDYESIVRQLEEILTAFGQGRTRAEAQEHLADLFIQYARSHQFDKTPELTHSQRSSLFRICFLILEKEQSQWQSACFWWGRWKLGMAVSFARLILLFKWGRITIDGLFRTFAIYSRVGMRDQNDEVRRTCDEIDKLYEDSLELEHLSEDDAWKQAYEDLVAVYGRDGDLTVDDRLQAPAGT